MDTGAEAVADEDSAGNIRYFLRHQISREQAVFSLLFLFPADEWQFIPAKFIFVPSF